MQAKDKAADKEPWTEPVIVSHEALRDVTGQKYAEKNDEKQPDNKKDADV